MAGKKSKKSGVIGGRLIDGTIKLADRLATGVAKAGRKGVRVGKKRY